MRFRAILFLGLFIAIQNAVFASIIQSTDLNDSIRVLNQKAFEQWSAGKLQESISTFKSLQKINEESGNENGARNIDVQLGLLYSELQDYETSAKYFQKSLDYNNKIGSKAGQLSAYTNLALCHRANKDFQKSNENAERGLSIAKELEQKESIRTFYGLMAENFQSMGNSEKAIEYFSIYTSLEKSIVESKEEDRQKELEEAKIKSRSMEEELTKKTDSLSKIEIQSQQQQSEIIELSEQKKEQEKLLVEKDESLQEANRIKGLLGVIVLLIIVFSAAQIVNIRKLRKSKNQLEKQHNEIISINGELKHINKNITASINYAKRIQDAMLPTVERIREFLPESFVLFKPKDIVSGDFYWFKHIEGYKSEFAEIKSNAIITAIDCTGHGVPGAFMSMIGNEILNRIVISHGITTSDGILNNLHTEITEALNQDEREIRDGMDLGLCVYSKEQNLLSFSGAKNPLLYIQDKTLHIIKGDKMPIGGSQLNQDRKFTKHQLIIDRPTYCYLLSDGFQDQFGGPDGRKYMIKRLKQLLLDIHLRPMTDQKDLLEQTFRDWKGADGQQIDDVLVIGFKLEPYSA